VNGPTLILTDKVMNSSSSFRSCETCGSPCVFVIIDWYANGYEPVIPLKHLRTTQDWHKIWCTLAVPFSELSWKLPQVMFMTTNKHVWNCPRPPSYMELYTLTHYTW
jgi:hypothetical protein